MFPLWAGWPAGGLVVEGEFAQEFAGGGFEDANVQVLDQEQDVGSGLGAADAYVVEPAAGAEGDVAGLADPVGADTVVSVGGAVAGAGFGPCACPAARAARGGHTKVVCNAIGCPEIWRRPRHEPSRLWLADVGWPVS